MGGFKLALGVNECDQLFVWKLEPPTGFTPAMTLT